jgi:hypothetical protein
VRYRTVVPPVEPEFDNPIDVYFPFMIVLTILLIAAYKIDNVYVPRRLGMWLDQMSRIVRSTMIAMLIMIGITFIYQPFFYSRLIYLYATILIMLLLALGRLVWGVILGQLRQRGLGVSRVLIVGAGDVGRGDPHGDGAARVRLSHRGAGGRSRGSRRLVDRAGARHRRHAAPAADHRRE